MQRNGKTLQPANQKRRLADMRNGWKHATEEQRILFLEEIGVGPVLYLTRAADWENGLNKLGVVQGNSIRQALSRAPKVMP